MSNLSRRSVTHGIAACALIASARFALPEESYSVRWPPGVGSFVELEQWLASLPNQQLDGSPTFRCEQTGEPYVEIGVRAYARPSDVAVIEAKVASDMQRAICELFIDRRDGVVYWRIPLEHETISYGVIVEYRDDGPDYDALTDRRCVKDNDWRLVTAYARLTVAPFA